MKWFWPMANWEINLNLWRMSEKNDWYFQKAAYQVCQSKMRQQKEEKICGQNVLPQALHKIVAASSLRDNSALQQRIQLLVFCFEPSFSSISTNSNFIFGYDSDGKHKKLKNNISDFSASIYADAICFYCAHAFLFFFFWVHFPILRNRFSIFKG